jgi:hypothetical protein
MPASVEALVAVAMRQDGVEHAHDGYLHNSGTSV